MGRLDSGRGKKARAKAAAVTGTAAENDPDTEVKKKAVFALAQPPPDESVRASQRIGLNFMQQTADVLSESLCLISSPPFPTNVGYRRNFGR